ncbi:MAG: methyltransferase domain-containing protein [Asgard group archaeon]|nr:methyltransferase domain-containing protein [Asgard group archaeon]
MTDSKEVIKESYAKALEKATQGESCCSPPATEIESKDDSCCPSEVSTSPKKREIKVPSFGSTRNLANKAGIKEGDVVVDFGSGPGHDLTEAAKLAGKTGKAIGIDMTPEMIEYTIKLAKDMALDNVEVKLGDIENVPLEDNIADVVISNCVINLTTDKEAVFKEAFRLLKPGGRLVDADIIAEQELPESLKNDKEAWCGCVAGALTAEGYTEAIKSAGFVDISINIESKQAGKIKWKDNKEYLMHSGIITAKKPN